MRNGRSLRPVLKETIINQAVRSILGPKREKFLESLEDIWLKLIFGIMIIIG